jgi:hypothetical protein
VRVISWTDGVPNKSLSGLLVDKSGQITATASVAVTLLKQEDSLNNS